MFLTDYTISSADAWESFRWGLSGRPYAQRHWDASAAGELSNTVVWGHRCIAVIEGTPLLGAVAAIIEVVAETVRKIIEESNGTTITQIIDNPTSMAARALYQDLVGEGRNELSGFVSNRKLPPQSEIAFQFLTLTDLSSSDLSYFELYQTATVYFKVEENGQLSLKTNIGTYIKESEPQDQATELTRPITLFRQALPNIENNLEKLPSFCAEANALIQTIGNIFKNGIPLPYEQQSIKSSTLIALVVIPNETIQEISHHQVYTPFQNRFVSTEVSNPQNPEWNNLYSTLRELRNVTSVETLD